MELGTDKGCSVAPTRNESGSQDLSLTAHCLGAQEWLQVFWGTVFTVVFGEIGIVVGDGDELNLGTRRNLRVAGSGAGKVRIYVGVRGEPS